MAIIDIDCQSCGASSPIESEGSGAHCAFCGSPLEIPKENVRVINRKVKVSPKAKKALVLLIGFFMIASFFGSILYYMNCANVPDSTDNRVFKTDGVYLAGADIPAGEYILYPDDKATSDDLAFYEVRKTKDSSLEKSDVYHKKSYYFRQYVTVEAGQYLYLYHSKLYKPERARLVALGENGYGSAQLKIGADIAAGEYVVMSDNKTVSCFASTSPVSWLQTNPNDPAVTTRHISINYRACVTVEDGEYLTVISGRLYRPEEEPPLSKDEFGFYRPGHYKLGRDVSFTSVTLKSNDALGATEGKFTIYRNSTRTYVIGLDNRHFEETVSGTKTVTWQPLEEGNEYYIYTTAYFK